MRRSKIRQQKSSRILRFLFHIIILYGIKFVKTYFLYVQILICRALCSHKLRRQKKFSSTFFKRWRGQGRVALVFGISFWELFLCASGFKEKVDKR